MEQRLTLVTLGVRDLARSRRFYEDALGWKPSSAGDGENVVFFQLGGIGLALFGRASLAEDAHLRDTTDPAGFGGITLAHNVRTRAEVDQVIQHAVASGGTLLKAAVDAPWGGYSGYFADPDGHPWEVAWNPGFPLGMEGALLLPKKDGSASARGDSCRPWSTFERGIRHPKAVNCRNALPWPNETKVSNHSTQR